MKHTTTSINHLIKLLVVLAFILLANEAHAQGTVVYGYDANGRLTSVTLPTGEAVTYSYDPAGNITAIQRVTGPGPQFVSFAPQSGLIGDTVTFTGANFGSITSIKFNGTASTTVSGTMTQLTATVPVNASTGPITVTLSNGTFTTSAFTVLAIQLTPSQVSLLPNATQQFTAVVPSQINNNSVTWSVNDIVGGNSSVGTISTTGLYVAPSITTLQTFTVKATSVARPTLFAQARVTVRPDLFIARCAAVSVSRNLIPSVVFKGLTVQKGVIVTPISSAQVFASPVSVTNNSVISSITPNTLARSSSATVTISGTNLQAVAVLNFINVSSGTLDTSITASNIVVDPSGTSLTATISSSASTSLGTKVVVLSDSSSAITAGSSNGNNTIEVTP